MKKMYVLLSVLILALFTSCATTNVFDESLPLEESTTLQIGSGWIVKAYNGIDVDLDFSSDLFGNSIGTTGFIIPAGETELLMDLHYREGGAYVSTTFTANDIILRYNFQAGYEYNILFSMINEEGKIPVIALGFGIKRALVIMCEDLQEDSRTPLAYWEMDFN
jgi:hypothetical protein